jgi:predicted RNA-binding protein with PIN domain
MRIGFSFTPRTDWISFQEGSIPMSRHGGNPWYIIDGYNVILGGAYSRGKRGRGASPVEDSRYHFLQSLSAYAGKKRVKLTVVWDGGSSTPHPRSETRNGVQSIFTPPGMSADEQIVRLVERRKNPREVTVVSDDRRHIIGTVRNLGAQTMSVGQFLGLIGNGHGVKCRSRRQPAAGGDSSAEKKRANDLSVDEWLSLFEVENRKNGKTT